MDPPRKEFDGLIIECREMIASVPENPRLKAFESQLSKIETAGKEASATKNQKKWITANDALRELARRIDDSVNGGVGPTPPPPPPPPPPLLKAQATKMLEALRSALNSARETRLRESGGEKWQPICAEFARKIDKMIADVRKIPDDAPSEQARAQVQSCLSSYDTIRKKIQRIADGTVVEAS